MSSLPYTRGADHRRHRWELGRRGRRPSRLGLVAAMGGSRHGVAGGSRMGSNSRMHMEGCPQC